VVEAYGSATTDLLIPKSDLDLVITGRTADSTLILNSLKVLGTLLKQQCWVKSETVQVIEKASVPVIKFLTNKNIPVDLTYTDQSPQNINNGVRAKNLIQQFMKEYPNFRPLILLLKQFLHHENLNNPYKGGLGSYCLVLMMISFLQIYHDRDTDNTNLGTLLLDFLQLYGDLFHFDKMIIQVREKASPNSSTSGCYSSHFSPAASQERLSPAFTPSLLLLDPFNPTRIMHTAFMINKIKSAFYDFYQSPQTIIKALKASLIKEEENKSLGNESGSESEMENVGNAYRIYTL